VATLYFAYGSNLKLEQMRARVPSARVFGKARLRNRRLSLDKRGVDGSGKANLHEDGRACVWGVLYSFDPADWEVLDRYEPGYARVAVEVVTEEGEAVSAETYVARRLTRDPVAFDWYKRRLVEGAREHGLPADYVAALEGLPERPDPDRIT
jgi:gamma-glutamylcyclotransferase (GGCT)/AIG2-like uncharacterized protein YtfP